MSTGVIDEVCSCGARYYYSGYVHMESVWLWRENHHHAEPPRPAAARVRLPRPRLRVRRMPTVPRRTTLGSGPERHDVVGD